MEVIKVDRKLVKLGNSIGSTFPPAILKHLNAEQGDSIEFVMQSDGTVTIKKQQKVTLPDGVDEDFINLVNKIVEEDDAVFKGLVNR
ncbi:AbrB/MazE/SpoVT family DNA-binding domain-containing protein [Sporolactobacillus nakayamae]|uniref:Putative addiction module antidote n=1 Tax=Sporolactobacillus nakayamae TaxID=269670 RepID=A0A1I2UDB8_9BACL|nr:AbrB family transcriptional regulator [Sporolactobacillus nakayamae]SFG75013.1 putative addiction module antidote [Sporolactobacillus nakayamae]